MVDTHHGHGRSLRVAVAAMRQAVQLNEPSGSAPGYCRGVQALVFGVEPDPVEAPEGANRLQRALAATPMALQEIPDPGFLLPEMVAFANYGFPESHSVSFAYLVYASSWIKLHYPAAFCAVLLNAQPTGFYSPHSLCQDARRHDVVVLGPDVNVSADTAVLEPCEESTGGAAVRLGLSSVRGVGPELAAAIAEAAPYESTEHRCELCRSAESLASRLGPRDKPRTVGDARAGGACGRDGCRRWICRSWRRWRQPGRSTRWAWTGAQRYGRPERWTSRVPTACPER